MRCTVCGRALTSFRITMLSGVQGRVAEGIQVTNYPCRILFRFSVQLGLGGVPFVLCMKFWKRSV